MDKKSKGVGLVPTVTSNWGTKKAKTKETAKRSSRAHRPSYDVQQINIADIQVVGKRRSLNTEKLNKLMESIPVLGLRQPITVRPVKRRRDWKDAKREYLLVSGFHRLEAKKRLGDTTIASTSWKATTALPECGKFLKTYIEPS